MVILPMACVSCGWRIDVRSDEPMPVCDVCSNKLRPAGKIIQVASDQQDVHPMFHNYNMDDGLYNVIPTQFFVGSFLQ